MSNSKRPHDFYSDETPSKKINNYQDGRSKRVSLQNVLEKEIATEINLRKQDLEIVEDRIFKTRQLLNRLRQRVASEFYKQPFKGTLQPPHHPAVRSTFAGKSPVDYEYNAETERRTEEISKCFRQFFKSADEGSRGGGDTPDEDFLVGDDSVDFEIGDDPPTLSPQVTTGVVSCKEEKEGHDEKEKEANEDQPPQKIPRHVPPNFPEGDVKHPFEPRAHESKLKYRVIIGNVSKWLADSEDNSGATHKWTVYTKTNTPDFDISRLISKVVFFLHPSYKPNDIVTVDSPPFKLSRRGWGEFPLRAQLHFVSDRDKPVDVVHMLTLDRSHTGIETFGCETVVDVWAHARQPHETPEPQKNTLNSSRSLLMRGFSLMPFTAQSSKEALSELFGESLEQTKAKEENIEEVTIKSEPLVSVTPAIVVKKEPNEQLDGNHHYTDRSASSKPSTQEMGTSTDTYFFESESTNSRMKVEQLPEEIQVKEEIIETEIITDSDMMMTEVGIQEPVSLVEQPAEINGRFNGFLEISALTDCDTVASEVVIESCSESDTTVQEALIKPEIRTFLDVKSKKPRRSRPKPITAPDLGNNAMCGDHIYQSMPAPPVERVSSSSANVIREVVLNNASGRPILAKPSMATSGGLAGARIEKAEVKIDDVLMGKPLFIRMADGKIKQLTSCAPIMTSSPQRLTLVPRMVQNRPSVRPVVPVKSPVMPSPRQPSRLQPPATVVSSTTQLVVNRAGQIVTNLKSSSPIDPKKTVLKIVNPKSGTTVSSSSTSAQILTNASKNVKMNQSNFILISNSKSPVVVAATPKTTMSSTVSSSVASVSAKTTMAAHLRLPVGQMIRPTTATTTHSTSVQPTTTQATSSSIAVKMSEQQPPPPVIQLIEEVVTTEEAVVHKLDESQLIRLCPSGSPESAVSWLIKRFPLIDKRAEKNVKFRAMHPYCAPTWGAFLNWPVGKQRAAEWMRAKTIAGLLKKICNDLVPWTTVEIMKWARRRCYAPALVKSDIQIHSPRSVIFAPKLPPLISALKNQSTHLEECDVDVVGIQDQKFAGKSVPEKLKFKNNKMIMLMSLEPSIKGLGAYVNKHLNEISIPCCVEEITDGVVYPAVERVLINAFNSMADDLIRRAYDSSYSRHQNSHPHSIEVEDVKEAILSRKEFDLFTKDGLGLSLM